MKDYKSKLENLHKETVKEGIVSDYLIYSTFKQWFDAPNLSFYQFGLLKQLILNFLKEKSLLNSKH